MPAAPCRTEAATVVISLPLFSETRVLYGLCFCLDIEGFSLSSGSIIES